MRLGKSRIDGLLVTDRHVEQDVAGMVGPDLRRALLHRVGDAGNRRQRRPFHLDRLDRVARAVDGLRDHESRDIADMADLVLGEDRVRRTGKWIDFKIEQAWQAAEVLDVLGRQDRGDAGKAAGAARIDGEFRVRVRRAQHQRMQRGLWRMVIGIAALAADQRIVLLAQDALADAEFDESSHRILNS